MKKILITICALVTLGLASCDESTTNPTDNNSKTLNTKEDILTSTLWERKYTSNINTTDGPITYENIDRLEFNKGLLQQTFFLYTYFKTENVFSRNGDLVSWTFNNDTITFIGTTGFIYTTKVKILKLTQDTLRFERSGEAKDKFFKAPFNDTVSIQTYYSVK